VAVEGDPDRPWRPRRDLLESGLTDRAFVGELDDDGGLRLRFGDGRAGALPPDGAALAIAYRLGNGPSGNVSAEAIDELVLCGIAGVQVSRVRNPLPATGGAAPEPVAEVQERAPSEARRRLRRAVTAADYAALASARPGVQRASADLRWNGSWYEARVAVDALGTEVTPPWLLDDVRAALHGVRRIGHGLDVPTARLVPLHLKLWV